MALMDDPQKPTITPFALISRMTDSKCLTVKCSLFFSSGDGLLSDQINNVPSLFWLITSSPSHCWTNFIICFQNYYLPKQYHQMTFSASCQLMVPECVSLLHKQHIAKLLRAPSTAKMWHAWGLVMETLHRCGT